MVKKGGAEGAPLIEKTEKAMGVVGAYTCRLRHLVRRLKMTFF